MIRHDWLFHNLRITLKVFTRSMIIECSTIYATATNSWEDQKDRLIGIESRGNRVKHKLIKPNASNIRFDAIDAGKATSKKNTAAC
jgi:hypothetical protein